MLRLYEITLLICQLALLASGHPSASILGYVTEDETTCQSDCVRHPTRCVNAENILDLSERLFPTSWVSASWVQLIILSGCWYSRKEYDIRNHLITYDLPNFPEGLAALVKALRNKNVYLAVNIGEISYNYEEFLSQLNLLVLWGVEYVKLTDGTGESPQHLCSVKALRQQRTLYENFTSQRKFIHWYASPVSAMKGCHAWDKRGSTEEGTFISDSGESPLEPPHFTLRYPKILRERIFLFNSTLGIHKTTGKGQHDSRQK